jgi:pantothenate kinase
MLEESIGSAIPVPAEIPLVVTEGNYLLADGPSWGQIRDLLDECWYVEPGEERRLSRLVARHVEFGRSPREAYERSHGADGRNAELISSTKPRATRVVEVPELPAPPPFQPGSVQNGCIESDCQECVALAESFARTPH